jgi:hypothetical protein
MPTFRRFPVLTALSAAAVALGAAAGVAEEFQCRRGDLVRRVEVRFADSADRLPCEVVYWKDDEAPGQPQPLWSAEREAGFCSEKAREMVARLESAGWACAAAAGGSEGPARTAAAPSSERPAGEPGEVAPARATGRPDQATLRAAPARVTGRPDQAPLRAAPARVTGRPDQATLRAALARDLRRLDQLTGGSSGGFTTDTAELGDLNGDGLEDAAVLLTHRGDGVEPSHYLLAYLFNGETFQPVARINLEAFYRNLSEIGIRGVADGAVDLLLRMPRAGDPQCCPSGRRLATFGLRDREFVLLRESEPGA